MEDALFEAQQYYQRFDAAGGLEDHGPVGTCTLEPALPFQTEAPETDFVLGEAVRGDAGLDVLRGAGEPGRQELQVQHVGVGQALDGIAHRIAHLPGALAVIAYAPAYFYAVPLMQQPASARFFGARTVAVPLVFHDVAAAGFVDH